MCGGCGNWKLECRRKYAHKTKKKTSVTIVAVSHGFALLSSRPTVVWGHSFIEVCVQKGGRPGGGGEKRGEVLISFVTRM